MNSKTHFNTLVPYISLENSTSRVNGKSVLNRVLGVEAVTGAATETVAARTPSGLFLCTSTVKTVLWIPRFLTGTRWIQKSR